MPKTTTYLTTTTLWHDARSELPKESGNYLAIIEIEQYKRCGYITMLPFSAKHRLFNEFDTVENPDDFVHRCVLAWAAIDNLFCEVYDFFHREEDKTDA